MLNKWNFKVAQFASKERSRYTLQALLVDPEFTVATNGQLMAWVSSDSEGKADNFPQVENAPVAQDDFKPFLMPLDVAGKVEKALPKKPHIPILASAGISHPTNEDQATVVVTDLETPQVFPVRPVSGEFPNFECVIPKPEDAKFRITLNAAYLAKVAKAMAEFGDAREPTLTISFYGDDRAIRFDASRGNGQGMTCMLMPGKFEGGEHAGSYGYKEREAKRRAERAAAEEKEAAEKSGDQQAEQDEAEAESSAASVTEAHS